MKKNGRNMFLCAGICILALTGCSMNSYATTAQTVQTGTQQDKPPADSGSMAKITSVENSSITVVLAENAQKPEGEPKQVSQSDGTALPEKPADGTTPPEKPADGTTPPEKPADGSTAADGEKSRPEMKFNGETKTYTIPSSAAITKGMEQKSASVSDLTVDTVVRITLDGETVTGINIME